MGHTVLVVGLPHVTDLQHNSPKVLNPGKVIRSPFFTLIFNNQADIVSFTDRKLCVMKLYLISDGNNFDVSMVRLELMTKAESKFELQQAQKLLYFCLLNELLLNE